MLNFWVSTHPSFGGFRAVPYPTVLAQVMDLDDKLFNTLPHQPPKKKTGSPGKDKSKESSKTGSPGKDKSKEGAVHGQSSSSVQQASFSEKSDKAQHILSIQPDHTPEDPNVWAEIMKLPGTRRNNQIADGYVNWLNKNFDAGIHEVNIYLFTHAPE